MSQVVESLEIIELDDVAPYEDDGDPNRVVHIVNPAMNVDFQQRFGRMTAQEIVDTARFFQLEVMSLCGVRFVPKHNPDKGDVCKSCMDLAGHIMRSDG